jgi:hypothetical protein
MLTISGKAGLELHELRYLDFERSEDYILLRSVLPLACFTGALFVRLVHIHKLLRSCLSQEMRLGSSSNFSFSKLKEQPKTFTHSYLFLSRTLSPQ